jgi:hypothetical protein
MDFVEEKRTREEWEKGLPKRTLKDLVEAPKWFFSQEGFWLWITERIMRQDWKELSPYGLAYVFNIWRGFNEDERRNLKEQYKKERKEWSRTTTFLVSERNTVKNF